MYRFCCRKWCCRSQRARSSYITGSQAVAGADFVDRSTLRIARSQRRVTRGWSWLGRRREG
eukprot:1001605-Pyramimonas_sp.AAC.1